VSLNGLDEFDPNPLHVGGRESKTLDVVNFPKKSVILGGKSIFLNVQSPHVGGCTANGPHM